MLATILLSIMMMAGLFLLLLAGVGFIQDKRFFSSAPSEALAVIPDKKPERFVGQHVIGAVIIVVAIVLMGSSMVIAAVNGINQGFGFFDFFVRFLTILLLLKVFDIFFFDWILLCNGGFNIFPGFYPETKPVLSPDIFGYNWKTHLTHVIAVPVIAVVLALVCNLI